ncbi:hypothetical protein [Rickettsia helvetica]|uniref:Beta-helix domain-containing protein n=1 Tax=Rickettsia helvetica TaxID=35789 RepID=A0ABM9NBT3_RICHE|nr:hypothetical protein [Rickettsia helvetica]MCZ6896361.1 hypothetical protein [Rickettsia endosymbiont of Ixodes ricinus]
MPENTAIRNGASVENLGASGSPVVGGDTLTFGSPSDIYNNLVNETINANGVRVIIDNPIVNLNLVEIRNVSTSHTNPISFSNDETRVSVRAKPQVITEVKNYNTISLSNEKKIVWDGAEILWIYDTKSNDIDAILIKDIRFNFKDIKFKFCCSKNNFDHNDNEGEGFRILIGDSHHSLIEVC